MNRCENYTLACEARDCCECESFEWDGTGEESEENEEMDSLYCYRFNPETGEIMCSKIVNYRAVTLCEFTGRYCFEYKNPTTRCVNRVKSENIDKLVNNKVYSFDPDIDHAKEIINKAILDKLNTAQAEKEKWLYIYNKLL